MNGSTENKAFGASESPDRGEGFLSLSTAQRMLPLVQRIVEDILKNHQVLEQIIPERDRLDRQRRSLTWPERQRRYQLREEADSAAANLQDARDELAQLGLTLLDADVGRVGFPTLVNDRRAFFSWRPGEEVLDSWHYAGESVCRPIPASWKKEIALVRKA
jgi:hypothetical protein